VALWSPRLQGGRIQSCRTCGAPKPSLRGRQDPEQQDMWRTRALPCKEAGYEATGHMVALELTMAGRQGPVLQDLYVYPVCRVLKILILGL
jgi:hypothetical protein